MRFFGHPPEDDVALLRDARPAAVALGGELPSGRDLLALTRARGVDFATAVLYEALRAHPRHGAFATKLEALPTPRAGAAAGSLVLVPGLLWEDYPQLGADGRVVLEVAQRAGFSAVRVPVNGRAALSDNAGAIVDFLDTLQEGRRWLVSLSKGSADLRFAMTGRYGAFPWDKIAGWINICGSPNGSDLAARLTGSGLRRLAARATCLASRIPFRAMQEISSHNALWASMPPLPPRLECVNVIGLPMRWHVSGTLAARHRLLSMDGPNDGVVLCANASVTPGLIYPLWGHDHYFRGAAVAPLLYRLFAYVRSRCEAPAALVKMAT